jgi:hypothetical protein
LPACLPGLPELPVLPGLAGLAELAVPIGKFLEKSRNRPDPNSTPHFPRDLKKSRSEEGIRMISRFFIDFGRVPIGKFFEKSRNRPDPNSTPYFSPNYARGFWSFSAHFLFEIAQSSILQ